MDDEWDDEAEAREQTAVLGARLRRAAGLSQAALAEAMQKRGHAWHQNTVSRFEMGLRRVNGLELRHLAMILGPEILRPMSRTLAPLGRGINDAIERGTVMRLRRLEASLITDLEDVRQMLRWHDDEWSEEAEQAVHVFGDCRASEPDAELESDA